MVKKQTLEQVSGYAQMAGFKSGDGLIWTTADLIASGLTPADIVKLKANAAQSPTGEGVFIAHYVMMTQIAWQESGWDAEAHGVGPRDDSYGLWQINTLGANWETLKIKFKNMDLTKKEQLFDPLFNAKVAFGLFQKVPGDPNSILGPPTVAYQPWTGSYQKALRNFTDATGQIDPASGGSNTRSGPGSTNTQIPDVRGLVNTVGDFIGLITSPSFWKRIGIGVLGFLIIVGALIMYNKDTIVSQAKKGAEVAAVAA